MRYRSIDNVMMEKIGNDNRMILYFKGKQKGMVCNKTNSTNISQLYGEETDGWLDKPIVLYAAWVDYQGKSVQGLRVRPSTGQTMAQHNVARQAQAPLPQGNPRGGTDQYHGGGEPAPGPATLNDSIPFVSPWGMR
mgnify:FL=1